MQSEYDVEENFAINVSVCEVVSHSKRKVAVTVASKDDKQYGFEDIVETDGTSFNFLSEETSNTFGGNSAQDKVVKELQEAFGINEEQADDLAFEMLQAMSYQETEEKVNVFFENVEIKSIGDKESIISYEGKDYTVNNVGVMEEDECFKLFTDTYEIRDIELMDEGHVVWNYIPAILSRLAQMR
ncbi:hypothetical protein [Billgrantia endophytica]|uniref:Uncharacterized protein n=1 Tax=Billgrantia endophytica TaxID=2033802 RepID=A0A2N7TUD4_9GAMM|nr:hypothetical protein [Halomonas endophytica]PMR71794.1 hypothetical protein C1H69_22945 [Halomonas endophytica]